jgi:cytoskeletal protein CcmA (bactofilin family)
MWDSKGRNTLGTPNPEPKDLHGNQSRLGPSLFVKGEISGHEDLLIDGVVEGIVRLNERKLMIGPAANVKADITAGEVVVRGNLKGNIFARDRIEVRNDGSVTGDLTTRQVFIEEGALFKGSIKIEKITGKQTQENVLSATELAPANASVAAASANNI